MRYAILRHENDGPAHYDLLSETGRTCVTCRFSALRRAGRIEGVRIADHRTFYLEYEGPVSGSRGKVVRVAAGECTSAEPGRIELSGDVGGRLFFSEIGQAAALEIFHYAKAAGVCESETDTANKEYER